MIEVLVLAAALAAQPQIPARTDATVSGRVVDAATGRPIPGALISVFGSAPRSLGGAPPAKVLTGSDGRFLIQDLDKGSLVLFTSHAGYLDGLYGQQRPGGSGQPLDIAPGTHTDDIVIRLWAYGVLTGMVVDEAGDPIVGVTVRAMARDYVAGHQRLTPSRTSRTDDRGVYRISNLLPGDYTLVVPSTISTVPADVLDYIFSTAPGDSRRAQFVRDAVSVGATIAPSGTPYTMNVAGQSLTLDPQTAGPHVRNGSFVVYPTTFYPGSPRASQASLVAVGSGQERAGIDVQVNGAPAAFVRGTVIGPDGPAPFTAVRLVPAGDDDLVDPIDAAATLSDASGVFTFPLVAAGAYTLNVAATPQPPADPGQPAALLIRTGTTNVPPPRPVGISAPPQPILLDPTLCAQVAIEVGERGADDLVVPLHAGPRMTGRVEFEGVSERPSGASLVNLHIALDTADGSRSPDELGPFSGHPNEDGTFATRGIPPGAYVVRVNRIPGWVFKGAFYNGRDISESAVEMSAQDISGVVLTFTDRPSTIAGTVHSSGSADPSAVVLAFPADGAAWSDAGPIPRRQRAVRVGKDGSFTITGVVPGDYSIVAVKEIGPANWQDPAVLRALQRVATTIHINDGDRIVKDLSTVEIK